jgi:pyruvate/2-oxoacid:ferredoxin oxidoreductase alpha subunit
MLGTVKTTDVGLVGWGSEATEATEEVDSESNIRIKDVGLYAALIP